MEDLQKGLRMAVVREVVEEDLEQMHQHETPLISTPLYKRV
jgi:hypothetical protein